MLNPHIVELSNVLAHTDHAHNLSRRVASRRRIQKNVHPVARLGEQREFVVRRLFARKCLVQNPLHRLFIIVRDVHCDKVLTHHLGLGEARDPFGSLVPFVDKALRVDPENRGVCRIDQLHQVVGNPLLLSPNTHLFLHGFGKLFA